MISPTSLFAAMSLPTLFLTSFRPLLVSSQAVPTNSTTVGHAVPSNDDALFYYRSITNTTTLKPVRFQGFNLTIPITNSSSADQTTNSTDNWSIIFGYRRVDVPLDPNVASSSQSLATGNTIFALTFPEQQWPLNDTDWQLCASVLDNDFLASVSNKKGNSSSGDCAQYLGESCTTAWQYAYRNAIVSSAGDGCPSPPLLEDIKECSSFMDASHGQSLQTGLISNITNTSTIYYSANNSYVDIRNNETYSVSNVPRYGLNWGQFFASRLTVFSSSVNSTIASRAEGRQLRMVGLSIVPSIQFKTEYPLYGYAPNVRMVCGRADYSAASGLRAIPSVTVLMALFATVVALW